MGFVSGAVSFRRFIVTGAAPSEPDEKFFEAIASKAFGRGGWTVDDPVEIGWITDNHLFDTSFAPESVAVGRFAHFRLRIDRNSPPASILRSYIEMERQAACEASGRDFLNREEKRQAKDAGEERAWKEARSGAYRRIAAVPVLYDLEKQIVYFGSTANNACEKLYVLFQDTFGVGLEPLSAHNAAIRWAENTGNRQALEDARPTHLINPPEGVDGDIYGLDPTQRGFLGREMLSWIWKRIDSGEGALKIPAIGELHAALAKSISLKCDFNLSGSDVIRCDAPAISPEARVGLTLGKQPSKMGLLLASRAGEWSFSVDAAGLDVSTLALPTNEDREKDSEAALEDRFEAIADLSETLDALFGAFLEMRFSKRWSTEWEAVARWAGSAKLDLQAQRPRLATA